MIDLAGRAPGTLWPTPEEVTLFRRADPSRLPEPERLAFVGALAAMANADGAASMQETLAVLEEIDLDDLTEAGRARACAWVLEPPPLETALEALRKQPTAMQVEVMARLVLVAKADGDLQVAENVALRRARRWRSAIGT